MKNISIKIPICLAATMIFSAACTDELADKSTDGTQAIAFAPATETRAAVNGSGELGNFKVWGWYGTPDAINKNVFDGKTIIAPNWTYEGGDQYWIPGNTYNFYGVYPANLPENSVAVTSDGNITITDFDCSATGADAVDLMTATRKGMDGSAPEKVALKFNHELAKVNFIVKAEGTDVTISNFKLEGVYYKGTLKNSIWKDLSTCTNSDSYFKKTDVTINNGNSTSLLGDLLVIPHTTEILNSVKFHITYSYTGTEKTVEANIPITEQANSWNAGMNYSYTFTIQANSLKLNVSVKDWNEEDTSVIWN